MTTAQAQAVDVARKMVADAAPGLPAMAQVAAKVAETAGVTTVTARKWLRAAVDAGYLHEITPDYGWGVKLPGGLDAGFPVLHVIQKKAVTNGKSSAWARRWEISTTSDRPSCYGPGTTSFVSTPERTAEILQAFADGAKTKEDAEKAARDVAKAEERAEIKRRMPGLSRLLRRLNLLLPGTRRVHVHLGYERDESKPLDERQITLGLTAYDDESAAVLAQILEAGINALLLDPTKPRVVCAHCEDRILHTRRGGREWWWHVESTNYECRGGETTATPAADSTRPEGNPA